MKTEKPLGELFGTMGEKPLETEKYKDLRKEVSRRRKGLNELCGKLKDYADALPLIPLLRNKDFWELQLSSARGDEKTMEEIGELRLSLDRREAELPALIKALMDEIKEEEKELKKLEDMTEAEWWNIPRGIGTA